MATTKTKVSAATINERQTEEGKTYKVVAFNFANGVVRSVYYTTFKAMLGMKEQAALLVAGDAKFAIALTGADVEYSETVSKTAAGEKTKFEMKKIVITEGKEMIDKWFDQF